MIRILETLAPPLALLLLLGACAPDGDDEHVEAMAREHAADVPTANAATQEPAQRVVAESVVYGSVGGEELTGYLARPADATGQLPALIVIHEWWGLNDNIRMMTRRLAGEGYVALAVDLYDDRVAEAPEQARQLMQSVMQAPERGADNLEAAAEYLAEQLGAERIGVIGWCFGGGWSLRGAVELPQRIDAAVVYYGQPITDPERLARLDAPLLGLFGGADQGIPVEQVREMEQTLERLGKPAEIRIYEGVGHAFANPSGDNYDPVAAHDAWERTTRFLDAQLRR